MKRLIPVVGIVACGLVPWLPGEAAWAADEPPESIVVVANPDLGVQSMTRTQVRGVFLGDLRYLESVPLSPIIYFGNNPAADFFLSEVMEMSENQFKSWWIKRIFRYGDVPPIRVLGSSGMVSRVLSTPGGIGFVPEHELPPDSPVVAVWRFTPVGTGR